MTHIWQKIGHGGRWWNLLEIHHLGPGKVGDALMQNCPGEGGEGCWHMGEANHNLLQAPDAGEATRTSRA